MSIRCRKNKIDYLCKLCIIPMYEIYLGRLTVNYIYCTDTFYLHLTDYACSINNLYQTDVGKTLLVINVN